MGKSVRRKLIASLCAMSSVGAAAKPAIDTFTYAAEKFDDPEAAMVSNLPEVFREILSELSIEYLETKSDVKVVKHGKTYTVKPIGQWEVAPDPGTTYTQEEGEKIKMELTKHLKEKFAERLETKLQPLGEKLPLNYEVFKNAIAKIKGPGLYKRASAMGAGYDLSIEGMVNDWVKELAKNKIDNYGTNWEEQKVKLKGFGQGYGVLETDLRAKWRGELNDAFLGLLHDLKQNKEMVITGILAGTAGLAALIALVTGVPALMREITAEKVRAHYTEQSQKQEYKENKKQGQRNVLRLDKVDLAAVRKKLNSIVKMYPYAKKDAKKFKNALYANLLRKMQDPDCNAGMLLVYGEPGSGKTNLVRESIKAIYNSTGMKDVEPLILSQSMIDEFDKVNSPAKQAWGVNRKDVAGKTISTMSPFASAVIQANKQKNAIVYILVDDADKFKDDVLRGLWDATDGGTLKIGDTEIPLSKIVVVMTANSNMSNKMNAFGGQGAADASKAFTSRCLGFNVNAPDAEQYEAKISEMFERLNAEYGDVNISKKTIKTLAKRCVDVQKGMRAVNEIETVTRGILSSDEYIRGKEITPVGENETGWLEQVEN